MDDSLEFYCNYLCLNNNLNSQIQEMGIDNNSLIFVKTIKKGIIGGGDLGIISFVDVRAKNIKFLKFNEKAPKWRKVEPGLNIFGICNNLKCEAFKKEVVHQVGFDEEQKLKFDIKNEVINIKCPMCYKIIKAKTCGFWKCEYQFIGKTIEDGEIKNYQSEPKETKNEEFEYFDPYKNGETEWAELIIYVLPKQKIKYRKN